MQLVADSIRAIAVSQRYPFLHKPLYHNNVFCPDNFGPTSCSTPVHIACEKRPTAWHLQDPKRSRQQVQRTYWETHRSRHSAQPERYGDATFLSEETENTFSGSLRSDVLHSSMQPPAETAAARLSGCHQIVRKKNPPVRTSTRSNQWLCRSFELEGYPFRYCHQYRVSDLAASG